jgi:hypothetical protein
MGMWESGLVEMIALLVPQSPFAATAGAYALVVACICELWSSFVEAVLMAETPDWMLPFAHDRLVVAVEAGAAERS